MTFQERFLTRKCFYMVVASQGTHQQNEKLLAGYIYIYTTICKPKKTRRSECVDWEMGNKTQTIFYYLILGFVHKWGYSTSKWPSNHVDNNFSTLELFFCPAFQANTTSMAQKKYGPAACAASKTHKATQRRLIPP